ncbi:hypothetical protein V1504DRAFT_273607 [Lipomyces starkeyi]
MTGFTTSTSMRTWPMYLSGLGFVATVTPPTARACLFVSFQRFLHSYGHFAYKADRHEMRSSMLNPNPNTKRITYFGQRFTWQWVISIVETPDRARDDPIFFCILSRILLSVIFLGWQFER